MRKIFTGFIIVLFVVNLTYAGNIFMDKFVDVGIAINNTTKTEYVKALKLKENNIKKGTILTLASGGYNLVDYQGNPVDVNVKNIYATVRYYIPDEILKKVDLTNINDEFSYQKKKLELFKYLHEYLYETSEDDDYILFSNDDNENLKQFKIYFGLQGYKGFPPLITDQVGIIDFGGSFSRHGVPQISCYMRDY